MATDPDTRKIVRLNSHIIAVVEPVDVGEYEAAGASTAVHLEVVELVVPKAHVEETA